VIRPLPLRKKHHRRDGGEKYEKSLHEILQALIFTPQILRKINNGTPISQHSFSFLLWKTMNEAKIRV